MHRHTRDLWSLILCGAVLAPGCRPTQPFYFMEDGDLSHYLDVATEIEYPDVQEPSLDEVTGALPPLTLKNSDQYEMWDLTLEEATRITLCNSQVMRQLGGAAIAGAQVAQSTPESISRTLVSSVAVTTTYDPALRESATGTSIGTQFGGTGVEAALAEFDAQLDVSSTWQNNDRPQNVGGFAAAFQAPVFQQDTGSTQSQISKTAANGAQFAIRNNTTYNANSNFLTQGAAPSIWDTNFEAFFSQPLLQGAGAQYNRIAGPHTFDQFAANVSNPFDGVVLARINTDQTLADFEGGVRNLMRDVEQSYWQLYFAYRDLEARKMGRDFALGTWQRIAARFQAGATEGDAGSEAQTRAQYFQFKAAVEQGLNDLYRAEARLRYVMGIAMSDGRLIRPADEPTTAQVAFDWTSVHGESQVRRVEIRRQKWEIKKRELELIASRNHLLPRLDAFGTYRWLGAGDNLIGSGNAPGPFLPGSNAFNTLTTGNFQEWEMGARFSLPIGFRRQLSGVRHHQLALARDRAILQDLELEVSFQLGDALRDVDLNYQLTQTNFNRRVAAVREVESATALVESGVTPQNGRAAIDQLLDAQRRRAEAESAYYRSLTDYNLSVVEVHYRKGSLLDYNGVYLAEGPWPGKAYFDAMRRARQRDASMYLDYGFTRPNVFSQGPHAQTGTDRGSAVGGTNYDGSPTPAPPADGAMPLPQTPDGQSAQRAGAPAVRLVNHNQAAEHGVVPAVVLGDSTTWGGGNASQADYTAAPAAAGAAGW